MMNKTITAISTALGNAGINIIRISGEKALDISKDIFRNKYNKKVNNFKSKYFNYGTIIDKNNKILDEVLLVYMKKPFTFTKEDVVEIHCHGGVISAKKILDLILTYDCRLAENGEFSKRAFLNGRIDLTQAEAIIDIINSKTDSSHEISVNQLEGRLSKQINSLINIIVGLIANIEVNIDFPEYDEDDMTVEKVREKSLYIKEEIKKLIDTADTGKIYKEGIKTLIVGKPNVGKSSLMNFLLNENRAIVTEVPGTTRDTIEEYINIKGIPLNIIDTAGIRNTDDIVEKIGVEKAISKIDEVDLIIMVFDSSKNLEEEDKQILKYIKDKKVIYIKNKTDLEDKLDLTDYDTIYKKIISISILKSKGLVEILNEIENMFFGGKIDISNNVIINNVRHKNLLINATNSIDEVIKSIELGMPVDYIQIDLKLCMESLGLIVGRTVSDDLVDKIFSGFCIGK